MSHGWFRPLVLLALAVFTLVAWGQSADLPAVPDRGLAAVQAVTPGYADLLRILEGPSPAAEWTIADFLKALRKSYPDFFNYYSLNYASRSVQQSSYENPRVLLYGNGNTLLSFNGSPTQRGFGHLELIEFKGSAGYEFRALFFGADGGRELVKPEEIERRLGSVSVSKANPRLCQACHGEKPRPIWDAYVLWPGFYGSDDDSLFLYGSATTASGSLQGQDLETPAWKRLQASYKSHARYSNLDGILAGYGFLDTERKRINLNLNKLFSYQMAVQYLDGLRDNVEALETLVAADKCKKKLPVVLYAANAVRLRQIFEAQKEHFEKTHGARFDMAPGAIDFMSGDFFASKMTAFELILRKYAGRELKDLSYSRARDLDLQDGGGGLRYLGAMARTILQEKHGRSFDFNRCDEVLRRLL